MSKSYKSRKRGTGRHVQLSEAFQATEAWETLKPGPRALYIALKRRYNGRNNGRIVLSHRQAAKVLNVSQNTPVRYFRELEHRGLIRKTRETFLGPSGVGEAPLWALCELATADGQPADWSFRSWRKKQKPVAKNGTPRHDDCDTDADCSGTDRTTAPKIVT